MNQGVFWSIQRLWCTDPSLLATFKYIWKRAPTNSSSVSLYYEPKCYLTKQKLRSTDLSLAQRRRCTDPSLLRRRRWTARQLSTTKSIYRGRLNPGKTEMKFAQNHSRQPKRFSITKQTIVLTLVVVPWFEGWARDWATLGLIPGPNVINKWNRPLEIFSIIVSCWKEKRNWKNYWKD